MSEQQWKLVPTKMNGEMRLAATSQWPLHGGMTDAIYEAAIAAAPQPPALVAELKPLAYIAFAGNGNIRCWSLELGDRTLAALKEDGQHIVELVDRAHVARLQRLVCTVQSMALHWMEKCDEERKHAAELEGLLRDALQFEVGEIDQDDRDSLKARYAALDEGAKS